MSKSISARVWLVANLVGLIGFFYLGRALGVEPEKGLSGGLGDGLYFLFFLAPILVFFCLVNFVALVLICIRWKQPDFKKALCYWLIVIACWVGNFGILSHNLQGAMR